MGRLRTAGIAAVIAGALAGGCVKKRSEEQTCQPYYDKGYAAGLAECEKPEEQAQPEEPAQREDPYRRTWVDEQTGARVEMGYDELRIEKGELSFYSNYYSDSVIYLNALREQVIIDVESGYPPMEIYDGQFLCDGVAITIIYINGVDKYHVERDKTLCSVAGRKWMGVCKELGCLERLKEWHEYRKNLTNLITPERLE